MPHDSDLGGGDVEPALARAAAAFGLSNDEIRAARPVRGSGFSAARLWKIETASTPDPVASPLFGSTTFPARTTELCLREWPPEHPSPERLRFLHAVQRIAHDRGATFVPRPLESRSGDMIHRDFETGRLWELTPWMPGEAHASGVVADARLRAAFAALATFHDAVSDVDDDGRSSVGSPPRVAPSPGLRERLRIGDELDSGRVDRILALARRRAATPHRDATERACRLFRAAWGVVRPTLVAAAEIRTRLLPCLRDCHREHVLFRDDRVAGLVDFGAIRFESPLASVARLAASYAEDDDSAWERGVFTPDARLTPDDVALLRAFDRSAAALSCFTWLTWIHEEEREFADAARVAARLERLTTRLERVARRADRWAE